MKLSNDSLPLAYTTTINDDQKRLDVVVRHWLPHVALSQIFQAIRKGKIRVNDQKMAANYRLQVDDRITYHAPKQQRLPPAQKLATDNNQPPLNDTLTKAYNNLEILYETNHLVAVNKPKKWIAHGHAPSLTHWLTWRYGCASGVSFERAPLHRLDVGTTGVIMLAKSLTGARLFSSLQQDHHLTKLYLAIVRGVPAIQGVRQYQHYLTRYDKKSTAHLQPSNSSKLAITNLSVITSTQHASLIACTIPTGRTHQIRAVCAQLGHPLIGDSLYNLPSQHKQQTQDYHLHSYTLIDKSEHFAPIHAPLPATFKAALHQYKLTIKQHLLDQSITKLLQ